MKNKIGSVDISTYYIRIFLNTLQNTQYILRKPSVAESGRHIVSVNLPCVSSSSAFLRSMTFFSRFSRSLAWAESWLAVASCCLLCWEQSPHIGQLPPEPRAKSWSSLRCRSSILTSTVAGSQAGEAGHFTDRTFTKHQPSRQQKQATSCTSQL